MAESLSPEMLVSDKTPPAFVWHTFEDQEVNVKNSLLYAQKLKSVNIPTELHIFPNGEHGLGLASSEDPIKHHISQWRGLLLNWLDYANTTGICGVTII